MPHPKPSRSRPTGRTSAPWGLAAVAAMAACALVAGGAGPAGGEATEPPARPADPLAALGWTPTEGAAPGYLEDEACRLCHSEIWTSYQEVAMARSFYRATPDRAVEDFAAEPIFHAPSRRFWQIELGDDGYRFRRWQVDPEGRRINVWETPIDWILGSGNHSRVYLYRIPSGELFQLPLAWYSQSGSWGPAPGYDRPDHQGVRRRVRRECMFCHNAYPEVPVGSDLYHQPQLFPEELPEGIGCQRCHGPGAAHVRSALSGHTDLGTTIVNPGDLAPELRDGLCFGCHLQPSVALPGIRRFGRPDYSFRPGEPIESYLFHLEVEEEGRPRHDRFEINHHPYRLRQSRCYTESEGRLSCLTCHDPHRKVPAEERVEHYARACSSCHEVDACRLDAMVAEDPEVDPRDCAGCHMPERRTVDVVRVTMTDHRIARDPGGPDLTAPLPEADPDVVDVDFYFPERAPEGMEGELYRAAAVLRLVADESMIGRLDRAIEATSTDAAEPTLDLARALVQRRRFAALQELLEPLLERQPELTLAREWLALARAGAGDPAGGIAALEEMIGGGGERPETRFNLAQLLASTGELVAAEGHLERAVADQPNQAVAWIYLGRVRTALGRPAEGVEALERAVAIEPDSADGYVHLAQALVAAERPDEARLYLRHGAAVARDPAVVQEALAELGAAPR